MQGNDIERMRKLKELDKSIADQKKKYAERQQWAQENSMKESDMRERMTERQNAPETRSERVQRVARAGIKVAEPGQGSSLKIPNEAIGKNSKPRLVESEGGRATVGAIGELLLAHAAAKALEIKEIGKDSDRLPPEEERKRNMANALRRKQ